MKLSFNELTSILTFTKVTRTTEVFKALFPIMKRKQDSRKMLMDYRKHGQILLDDHLDLFRLIKIDNHHISERYDDISYAWNSGCTYVHVKVDYLSKYQRKNMDDENTCFSYGEKYKRFLLCDAVELLLHDIYERLEFGSFKLNKQNRRYKRNMIDYQECGCLEEQNYVYFLYKNNEDMY